MENFRLLRSHIDTSAKGFVLRFAFGRVCRFLSFKFLRGRRRRLSRWVRWPPAILQFLLLAGICIFLGITGRAGQAFNDLKEALGLFRCGLAGAKPACECRRLKRPESYFHGSILPFANSPGAIMANPMPYIDEQM